MANCLKFINSSNKHNMTNKLEVRADFAKQIAGLNFETARDLMTVKANEIGYECELDFVLFKTIYQTGLRIKKKDCNKE